MKGFEKNSCTVQGLDVFWLVSLTDLAFLPIMMLAQKMSERSFDLTENFNDFYFFREIVLSVGIDYSNICFCLNSKS